MDPVVCLLDLLPLEQREKRRKEWDASATRKDMTRDVVRSSGTDAIHVVHPITDAFLQPWWHTALRVAGEWSGATPFVVVFTGPPPPVLDEPVFAVDRRTSQGTVLLPGAADPSQQAPHTDYFVFSPVMKVKEPVIWINPVQAPGAWCTRIARFEHGRMHWTRDWFWGSVDDPPEEEGGELKSFPLADGRKLWYRSDARKPLYLTTRKSDDSDATLQFLTDSPGAASTFDILACFATV